MQNMQQLFGPENNYSQTSLIRTPKGQNQVSALQRCPYYSGRECMIFGTKRTVRKERLDCKNFEKGWVTFHVFCCRYVFLVHGRQKKALLSSENPGCQLSCTLNQSILTENLHNCSPKQKSAKETKNSRPQSRVFVLQTRGSFSTTTIYIEWKKHWTITMPQHNT